MSAINTEAKFHPYMILLIDLHQVWDESEMFVRSHELIARLIQQNPDQWDSISAYGRPLTVQRMGRLLSGIGIAPIKNGQDQRGYVRQHFNKIWAQTGINTLTKVATK